MGHHSGLDLRARSTPVGFDDIARGMATMLFSAERSRSYWNVQRMIDFAMSFFFSIEPCSQGGAVNSWWNLHTSIDHLQSGFMLPRRRASSRSE